MTPDDDDRKPDADGPVDGALDGPLDGPLDGSAEPASPGSDPEKDPKQDPTQDPKPDPWDDAGIEAAFADIVARLQSDGVDSGPGRSSSPARPPRTPPPDAPATGGPAADEPGSAHPATPASPDPAADAAALARRRRIEREVDAAVDGPDGGHFVPPEPTPLPRPDAITLLAWIAVIGGPLFLVAGTILGGLPTWLAGGIVAAVVVGFVLLVSRLPRRRDVDPGDDGAVV